LAGGAAFYRSNRLERLFRDAQAARYHPLAQVPQKDLAARLALGLEVKQAA
jgi:acyl-CoA dehydrogenase